jgi:hypothetical protein
LAGACGFSLGMLQQAPLRKSALEPLDALYVYLDAPA